MLWSAIDLDAGLWTKAFQFRKRKPTDTHQHLVPLVPMVIAVLRKLRGASNKTPEGRCDPLRKLGSIRQTVARRRCISSAKRIVCSSRWVIFPARVVLRAVTFHR
jgi:hypothetical protein